jgi:proteic killer suppression protein
VQFRFDDGELGRLYTDPHYSAYYGPNIVKAFRKVIGLIKDAADERDFYKMKSLHYEKLQGKRSHQRSMRLNQQFRLIIEIEGHGDKTVAVISVEKHYE